MGAIIWRGEQGDYSWAQTAQQIQYGHCEAGIRWFWFARKIPDITTERYGYVGDECDAIAASREAVKALAGREPTCAMFTTRGAVFRLKQLRKADRAARRKTKAPAALAKLRQAMLDAHPDRGGSSEAFIEARERYETARRAAGKK
jgi:hypothetical protein